jgi:hypothetical protein
MFVTLKVPFWERQKSKLHYITESTDSGLNSANSWHYSIQHLLDFPLSKSPYKLKYTSVTLLVLYGCETWSLALREEHGLRVSENRALGRIYGPKREEVAGG